VVSITPRGTKLLSKSTGLVSVIVPNFNCAVWLPKVVSSCLEQGDLLKEIIVVDDGSTDDSHAVLASLAKCANGKLQVLSNERKGANNARNLGFSASTGAFIQWLDADDLLLPGKFAAQVSTFESNPGIDVVYSDWYEAFHDHDMQTVRTVSHRKSEYDDFTYEILSDNWSALHSYLFRRDIADRLHEAQAWKPSRKIAQDREYVTLAALMGAKFAYTPGLFSIYNRWSNQSISSMDFKQRLSHQLELEHEFRVAIRWRAFPKRLRRKYLSALNAHTLNACYYNPKLALTDPFWIGNVRFSLIHYKKYPFIPFIYLCQHLRYFLRRLTIGNSALSHQQGTTCSDNDRPETQVSPRSTRGSHLG
jgi:glycosyltransferase involved in cell wall biosynthesis